MARTYFRKNPTRIVGMLIVIVWLVLMGILIARQKVARPENTYNIPAALLEEKWMNVRFMGEKVGWAHGKVEPIEDGYLVKADVSMSILALGVKQEFQSSVEARIDKKFRMKNFSATLNTKAQNILIEGEVEKLTLSFRIHSPPHAPGEERKVKIKEPITLVDVVALKAVEKGLKGGEKFKIYTFDPMTQSLDYMDAEVSGREEVEVMGGKINAWALKTRFLGVDSRYWIDEAGRTLRVEAPMGIVMELTTKADAMRKEGSASLDIVEEAAILPDKPIFSARSLKYLKLKLSGVESMQIADLDGGVQSALWDEANGEKWAIVTINIPHVGDGYELPDNGFERESYLVAEPLLQSDDPQIKKTAFIIVGEEKNAVKVAELLNNWVFENVRKKPALTIPSALDVLKSKEGDCNEHTILYVALARALGLPARVAVGVVYLNGAFYYHAWPEIWLGDGSGWVPTDPTFGIFPADASRVRLAVGSLQNQMAVAQFMGKLKIEVLEF
mgnify:CR=1 FL=1